MAFFKRELSPVERFEKALRDKLAARQTLAGRLSAAESVLAEKRTVAERLAMAGASSARLGRAEADMRAVEDRARTLRGALMESDEQIVTTERALAEATAQRDRELEADAIEAIAAAIERATPAFDAASTALVEAAIKNPLSVLEATGFSTSVARVVR
jgi:hypothetical protein